MKKTTEPTTPPSGRPKLYGEEVKRCQVTLPQSAIDTARSVGAGNLSRGLALIVAAWSKKDKKRPKDFLDKKENCSEDESTNMESSGYLSSNSS